MSSPLLVYDPVRMYQAKDGVSPDVLRIEEHRLERARERILVERKAEGMGWLDLPTDLLAVKRIKAIIKATASFETLLVLGIGGSDLGARAILQALPTKKRVLFAGANTDADELAETLKSLDLKRTCVNVISKSGNTIETMSAFLIVREKLKRIVGKKFAEQIIATTDAASGILHDWAEREGYRRLIIPANVGGRFSVLSDVGLFPAAWAGVSIEKLLAGAAAQMRAFEKTPLAKQACAQYAMLHASWYKRGRSLFVFMPYVARLEGFARWQRQLVAESLGKALDRHGRVAHIGPTPLVALGATDQHSQLQLFMEGPADKVITFVELKTPNKILRIPRPPFSGSLLDGLYGKRLDEVQRAERQATADALTSIQRPHGTLFVPQLDAYALGQLFQLFMLATALLGELLDVNAYDQPGVEEGKRRLKVWLREGRWERP